MLEYILQAGCGLLVFGCGLLVFGCWLLVFGCRLLVFGCRLLVFGCRYWLPAKATYNLQPNTNNQSLYIFIY